MGGGGVKDYYEKKEVCGERITGGKGTSGRPGGRKKKERTTFCLGIN